MIRAIYLNGYTNDISACIDVRKAVHDKEYGEDAIQIHEDALTPDDIVLIHDDLLATGGTMVAAYKLVKKLGVKEVYINFLIELEELEGRKQFPEEVEVLSMIKF